jgi:hypothetical protein
MKRKVPERVERRRPLVEINLIGEPRARSARLKRRGCALFGTSVALMAIAVAAFLGLH